ncbi:MAG: alpha/beta fold hydrolase [Bacilli bacterium]|nr:alpha/beta fold hydrolase [Bacilli bacterium]
MLFLYIGLGLVGAFLLFYLIPTMLISNRIYSILLIRQNKNKWSRSVSWDNEEQKKMFEIGEEFHEEFKNYNKKLKMKNEGFNLVAEYYDFGFKKCVIIIPGRMEAGTYSLYFAKPFKENGYNILAIDNRSHGESDGRYNCLGLKEYSDIIAWSKLLHDENNIETIIIHGICIGSATALYALTSDDCPEYVRGMIADGMYANFGESLKNHLIERSKPVFPFTGEIMWMVSVVARRNAMKNGPIDVIDKLKKPILFLYSKEDIYSTADQANALYEKCNSDKKIVWFDKGVHSHIRINNTIKYDNTIKEFLDAKF